MPASMHLKEAVLIELPANESMSPLLEHRSVAMLPVAGKPVVQYWCEQLHQTGVKRLHLIVCSFPDQVRRFVENGARWGLEITLSTIPEKISANLLFRQIQPYVETRALISNFQTLPIRALEQEEISISTISASGDQAMSILSKCAVMDAQELVDLIAGKTVDIKTVFGNLLRTIDHPKELWQANMDLIAGRIEDPLPVGFENDEGIFIDKGVQIKPNVNFFPYCRIGQNTLLQNRSQIGPNTVIGSHCIIDESSQIKESVIMANTYVGSHSYLDRVIADGRLVYQVENELATWIDDQAIIGSMQIKTHSVSLPHRFFACLLFILCLPGLTLLTLYNLCKSKPVFKKQTLFIPEGRDLMGGAIKQAAEVYTLNTGHCFWRKVPWLIAVISGRLNLVGTTAEYQETADVPAWARELGAERPGLVNLYDLVRSGDNTANRYVTDSYYVTTRSFTNDALLIGKWFLQLMLPLTE